jgi:Tol biopolymer transport system component
VKHPLGVLGFAFLAAAPARAQLTERMSVASGGAQGNSASSSPSISGDGRIVVFVSEAFTLVANDTNGFADVFARDRLAGTTQRVSVSTGGAQGDSDGFAPAISADGRFVAFFSTASNLVPGDTNGFMDVFVRDLQAGTTELVSVGLGGAPGDGACGDPDVLRLSISADGRYVGFDSAAANLVAGDVNDRHDVFLRDRLSGTTEIVSLGAGGVQADLDSFAPSMSADGRHVAFQSYATNLVAADVNDYLDVFVRDRLSATTEIVSVSTFGTQGISRSQNASISGDGRFVAFDTRADEMVAGDANSSFDCFLRDRSNGTTTRVSVDANGTEAPGHSVEPSLSADGRFVAFTSEAVLVGGDVNAAADVHVRDLTAGTLELVSLATGGMQGNGDSAEASISADGRNVAFAADAMNLVSGDTNAATDVFLRDRDADGFTSVCTPGQGGVIACPCSNPPAGTDRGCENSSGTGGASLSASGFAYLSIDSLVFTTGGERPTALSIVLQGNALAASGLVYGQGVRCAAGSLKRLYTRTASGGSITAPDFGAGDPTVSARSAAAGDPIQAGESRWYLVYYRDPIVLGGCAATSTFNATDTGRVDWSL